jgi:hypothetical protein
MALLCQKSGGILIDEVRVVSQRTQPPFALATYLNSHGRVNCLQR